MAANVPELILPDEKFLREPNLLVPGKKPIGPVKIDWNNPVSDKLAACYLHNEHPSRALLNLASGKRDLNFVDNTGGLALGANDKGLHFEQTIATGTGDYHRILDSDNSVDWFRITDAITLLSIYTHHDDVGSSYPYVISRSRDSTAEYAIGYMPEGGTIPFNPWIRLDGVRTYADVTTVPGDTVHLVGTYGDGYRSVYLNGEHTNSDAASGAIPDFGDIGIGANPKEPSGRMHSGKTFLSLVFNRVLSAAEIKGLYLDPYQFLVPA